MSRNLIKPKGNEAFWSPKPETAPITIEKALPREGFRIAFSQSEDTL